MSSYLLNIPGHASLAAAEAVLLPKLFGQWGIFDSSFKTLYLRLLGLHLLFILFYFFIYQGLIYPYFLTPLKHFPSAKGSKAWVLNIKSTVPENYVDWLSNANKEDSILLLRRPLNDVFLILTDPKVISEVLVHNSYDYQKPAETREFLRKIIGDGLVVVEGDEHKFQRKHVQPAFGFRNIKALYPMMYRKALTLVDRVKAELPEHSNTVEVYEWASRASLDIIGVAGLGREMHALRDSTDELVKSYETLFEISTEKLIYYFLILMGTTKFVQMLPWKMNKIFKDAISTLRRVCRSVVLEKRELVKTSPEENLDMLSVLVKSGDFSDDELVNQVLTFLAAGHETTAASFTWLTFLLATHPSACRRLRDELANANLPTNPSEIFDAADLSKTLESLPYLNGVLNESLRLYPTVPITIRAAQRDSVLAGHRIQKGTTLLIPLFALNRSEKLWGPDGAEFKPERWIDIVRTTAENGMEVVTEKPNNHGGVRDNYCHMTFLHGPRSCIGQAFARAELRCLAATWVRAFDWTMLDAVETIRPRGIITVRPESGLRVRMDVVDGMREKGVNSGR